jgi:hypothetical protein
VGSPRTTVRRVLTALVVATAVTVSLAVLGGCGGSTEEAGDPLAGYWIGGDASGMNLVHIVQEGDSYAIFANPDYRAPAPTMEGSALVIDSHVVKMTLTPAGTDKLTLEYTGEMFGNGKTVAMKRVDEAAYADAATSLGLQAIQRGLVKWKEGGGKKYPPADEVTPTGLVGKMIDWPTNLFSGQPMQPSTDPGDYKYKRLDGGKAYSLLGYRSDGSTIGK